MLTSIKVKLPTSIYRHIALCSDLSLKGIDITVGIIDRDYRGEMQVVLINNSYIPLKVNISNYIMQLIVEQIATVEVKTIDSLEITQ